MTDDTAKAMKSIGRGSGGFEVGIRPGREPVCAPCPDDGRGAVRRVLLDLLFHLQAAEVR